MDAGDPRPDATPDGWSRVAEAYEAVVSPFLSKYAEDALAATDFAPGMVERLAVRVQAGGLDLEVEQMDGQALDVEDCSFDAAYSNFGLIFFPDRARGFQELRRVLAPGGRAAVTAWSQPDRLGFFRVFQEAVNEVAPDPPPPAQPPAAFSLADPRRLEQEMLAGGFASVEVHQLQHTWEIASADAVWDAMTTTNPVMPGLMERLGSEHLPALKEAIGTKIRDEFGTGPVRLEAEAHLAIGRG